MTRRNKVGAPAVAVTAQPVAAAAVSKALDAAAVPVVPAALVAPVAAAAAATAATAAESGPVPSGGGAQRARSVKPARLTAAAAETLAPDASPQPVPAANAGKVDAAATRSAKADKEEKMEKAEKATVKPKLVRDSFTMPRADFALIALLKERALGFKRAAKKSELLRAGLHALAALDDARLQAALEELAPVKAGRPKKS